MKKIKGYISIIVLILAIGYVGYSTGLKPVNVKNDSGFDTSYSGGGSSSHSSSYHSSSRSHSSSGSGEYRPLTPEEKRIMIICMSIFGVFFVGFVVFVAYIVGKECKATERKNKLGTNVDHENELSEDKIRETIPDFELQKFLDDRLQDFIDIQKSWQEFDYEKLRELLTDSLYNQYKMQLESLKERNQKNIMDNFNFKDSVVTSVEELNGKYTICMELSISFNDYIEENGNVVRGCKTDIITHRYSLVFVSSKYDEFEYCPNCGAKLSNAASQKCEYCHSTISRVSTRWVMSDKHSLFQTTEKGE
jgi:hypothetical protein